jgi:uncharacterized protein (TIGR02186 family)
VKLRLVLLALLALVALPLRAEEVVAGLSQNRVSISADFDGSEILIFGAVKREARIDTETPLHVVVTVAGPRVPVTVRRKEKVAGIWVNTDAVKIETAPSFYAVASTAPLDEILGPMQDLINGISIDSAIGLFAMPEEVTDSASFTRALVRIRERGDLYQTLGDAVELREHTLFETRIALPANLVEGNYTTRIFLIRDGAVRHEYETLIFVHKVGLERLLYTLAHEQPLVYGLLSLFIAIVFGWAASALFRYIRG